MRYVWALHAIGAMNDSLLSQLLASANAYTRGWAIQFALEDRAASIEQRAKLADLAKNDPSPAVRMFLASGLGRLPVAERWSIAAPLVAHKQDAEDRSLSLMMWYGFEPLVPLDRERALAIAAEGENPTVRRYAARRAVEHDLAAGLDAVARVMAEQSDAERQLDLLAGAYEALGGVRQAPMPASWSAAHAKLATASDGRVRSAARRLAVLFGDRAAIDAERRKVVDRSAAGIDRREAIEALATIKDPSLPGLLFQALPERDGDLARAALRGLAGYDSKDIPRQVLDHYSQYDEATKRDAISTLTSRVAWAEALLAAIDSGLVARGDLEAYHIQQFLGLKNDQLTARLKDTWGSIRPTAADKQAAMHKLKSRLTPAALAAANLAHGRGVFVKNCSSCHALHGVGGKIGPDLTGSQRANLDYVLSNVLDPSAVVAKEYQITVVVTGDGRTISGIVKHEDDKSLTLQTATEQVILPKGEVEERRKTNVSIMPDGLLSKLNDDEIRDLVAYLANREQAPLQGD